MSHSQIWRRRELRDKGEHWRELDADKWMMRAKSSGVRDADEEALRSEMRMSMSGGDRRG
eukprot:3941412-Rhodomonas_salina.2